MVVKLISIFPTITGYLFKILQLDKIASLSSSVIDRSLKIVIRLIKHQARRSTDEAVKDIKRLSIGVLIVLIGLQFLLVLLLTTHIVLGLLMEANGITPITSVLILLAGDVLITSILFFIGIRILKQPVLVETRAEWKELMDVLSEEAR